MNKLLIFLFFCLIQCGFANAESKLSLGLGYPYISGKYDFSEKTSGEFRFATTSGIKVYSGRFYWNFKQYNKLNIFTGAEAGYVNFNTLDMKGTGYETGVLIGGEYFINPKLSFVLDFAPVLIGLKSDDYKVSGVELVLNLGLYLYFSPRNGKEVSMTSSPLSSPAGGEGITSAPYITPSKKAAKKEETEELSYAEDMEENNPTDSGNKYEDYLEQAEDYFTQKDYANAINKYNEDLSALTENDKRRVYVYERLGAMEVRQKNIAKAKEYYLAAITSAKKLNITNRDVVNAYLGLGYCFEMSGKPKSAIRNYEKALELAPDEKTRINIRKRLNRLKSDYKGF